MADALRSGVLGPPYTHPAVRSLVGSPEDADAVAATLGRLEGDGVPGSAVALLLEATDRVASAVPRPDLVWSGPEVPGLHARDTRRVYEELLSAAEQSAWVSSYAYFDGPQAFAVLARRMDEVAALDVTLLLNIQRRKGDTSSAEALVDRFADRFWTVDWPGQREPRVFYDPRSLEPEGPAGVPHAKAVVTDDQSVFVTSANLTEAALDRNIEVGLLSRDPALAASLGDRQRSTAPPDAHLAP